jgi:signal recognition particle subunit SRP54
MPGGGGKKARGRTAPPARRGKAKSGNPAKRAQQEREAADRAAAGPAQPAVPGDAFGLGAGAGAGGQQAGIDPASLELPPGFEKFLGR